MYSADFIEQLLEKYWEGESSLEEERILKAYFQGPDPDPRFEAEVALFRTLRAEQSLELRQFRIRPLQDHRRLWASVAAAVLVVLSAGIWWWTRPETGAPAPVAKHAPPVAAPRQPAPQTTATEQPPRLAVAMARPAKRKRVRQEAPMSESEKAAAEAAMEEIKQALSLVSGKIRLGREEAVKGLQEVDHMEIIKKNTDS